MEQLKFNIKRIYATPKSNNGNLSELTQKEIYELEKRIESMLSAEFGEVAVDCLKTEVEPIKDVKL